MAKLWGFKDLETFSQSLGEAIIQDAAIKREITVGLIKWNIVLVCITLTVNLVFVEGVEKVCLSARRVEGHGS